MHATQAAVEEGIVPGARVALLRASKVLQQLKLEGDEQVGVNIIAEPCQRALALGRDDGEAFAEFSCMLHRDSFKDSRCTSIRHRQTSPARRPRAFGACPVGAGEDPVV